MGMITVFFFFCLDKSILHADFKFPSVGAISKLKYPPKRAGPTLVGAFSASVFMYKLSPKLLFNFCNELFKAHFKG